LRNSDLPILAGASSSCQSGLRRRNPEPEHRRHTRSSRAKCSTCERDANGRINRDSSQRRAFQRANPCPSTGKTSGACPGYVVDHIKPLKRGGADEPGVTNGACPLA